MENTIFYCNDEPIDFESESWVGVSDISGSWTYYDGDVASFSGTDYNYLEFSTQNGTDAGVIFGYITFSAEGFDSYEYDVDHYF